ncbi:hypothetical protein ACVBAX_21360 [Robertmurraya sp. GLU-23]
MSTFKFDRFTQIVEEKKVEVLHQRNEQNYVLMVIQQGLPINDINWSAFGRAHIMDVMEELEDAITDENEDGELCLNPYHPYTQMFMISNKISGLVDVQKVRPTSPFPFI